MLLLKLLFIPVMIFGFLAGRKIYLKHGSIFTNKALGKKLNIWLLGAFLFAVAAAAFIRLTFDIELMLPQYVRMHATHFKWFGVELLFSAFIGFAAGIYSGEIFRFRFKFYLTSAILLVIIFGFENFYTRPIFNLCKDIEKDGVVFQTFQSTCGPASLANLFRAFGKKISEREAARLARTRYTGTTGNELAAAAAAISPDIYAYYFKLNLDELEKLELPCVLSFNEEHFVVYSKKRKHLYEYIDPSIGTCYAKKDDLMAEWDGKALFIFDRDFTFTLSKGIKDQKASVIKKALNDFFSTDKSFQPLEINDEYDEKLENAVILFCSVKKINRNVKNIINPYANLAIMSAAKKANASSSR